MCWGERAGGSDSGCCGLSPRVTPSQDASTANRGEPRLAVLPLTHTQWRVEATCSLDSAQGLSQAPTPPPSADVVAGTRIGGLCWSPVSGLDQAGDGGKEGEKVE